MKKRRIIRKKKSLSAVSYWYCGNSFSSRFGSVSGLVLGPDCGGYHLHSLLKNGLAMLVRAQRFGGLRHLRYGIAALLGLGRSGEICFKCCTYHALVHWNAIHRVGRVASARRRFVPLPDGLGGSPDEGGNQQALRGNQHALE